MSIESELAKRDRLLAEKSARIRELEHMVETRGESIRNLTELLDKCHARIRELEALLRVFHHCAQQGKCANCKYFRGNDGCGESIFERYDALELRGDAE